MTQKNTNANAALTASNWIDWRFPWSDWMLVPT